MAPVIDHSPSAPTHTASHTALSKKTINLPQLVVALIALTLVFAIAVTGLWVSRRRSLTTAANGKLKTLQLSSQYREHTIYSPVLVDTKLSRGSSVCHAQSLL